MHGRTLLLWTLLLLYSSGSGRFLLTVIGSPATAPPEESGSTDEADPPDPLGGSTSQPSVVSNDKANLANNGDRKSSESDVTPEVTTGVISTGNARELVDVTAPMGTEEPNSEEDKPAWQTIIERVQFVMTLCGFFANMITMVSLVRKGSGFNPAICLLLKHQSLIDAGVCLIAATLLVQPSLWTSGVTWLDAFVCMVWHSQALYWFTVLMSVWNLVLVSGERYMAVCMPFSHINLSLKNVRWALFCLYPWTIIASSFCFVQYRYDFGKDACLVEYLISGQLGYDVFYGYAILCVFTYYVMPLVAYVGMYSRILYTLKVRSKDTTMASSKIIESATDAMTKSAVACSVIFIFSIGFEIFYYALGYTGVVPYAMDSPLQKIGVFLAVFNSCVNPCVYVVLMPGYRRSVRNTFCCGHRKSAGAGLQPALPSENIVAHGNGSSFGSLTTIASTV